LPLPSGVVWVAPIYEVGGYGTHARNYLKSLHLLNIPIHLINIGYQDPEIGEEYLHFIHHLNCPIEKLGSHLVWVIDAIPESFPLFQPNRLLANNIEKRIGITVFETDRIPAHWVAPCNEMDEIWVPSPFNVETFSRSGVNKEKLRVVPRTIDFHKYQQPFAKYPFTAPVKSFKFLYNCAFDYRKGIDLLIQSYCEEFSEQEDVSLILKVFTPGWSKELDVPALLRSYVPQTEKVPHIHFMLAKVSERELLELYSSCDCYVSTERANGWSNPAMEMMALGKPVIHIGWGGNTAYMNAQNAFLIEHEGEYEAVDERLSCHRPKEYEGHRWIKVAPANVRKTMREAYENKAKRERVARQGCADIQQFFSTEKVADLLRVALQIG
jgi:glycosyltransferase involved in cell wall biosynthesis